jgi:hypothetical protein
VPRDLNIQCLATALPKILRTQVTAVHSTSFATRFAGRVVTKPLRFI